MFKTIYKQKGRDINYNIWHRSDEHMIIFVNEGDGSIVCAEKIYPIKKGALCLIAKGKYHYTLPSVPEKYIRSKLFFDDDEFNKILPLLSDRTVLTNELIYSEIPNDFFDNVDNIFSELNANSKIEICYSSLLRLFYFLLSNKTDGKLTGTSIINKCIEYVNENIKASITIDQICENIHISKYHLCHLFKEKIGMTIMQYILNTRITLAKSMLLCGEKTISDISMECGFSGLSYFSRVFKENTGKTPLEYRKG